MQSSPGRHLPVETRQMQGTSPVRGAWTKYWSHSPWLRSWHHSGCGSRRASIRLSSAVHHSGRTAVGSAAIASQSASVSSGGGGGGGGTCGDGGGLGWQRKNPLHCSLSQLPFQSYWHHAPHSDALVMQPTVVGSVPSRCHSQLTCCRPRPSARAVSAAASSAARMWTSFRGCWRAAGASWYTRRRRLACGRKNGSVTAGLRRRLSTGRPSAVLYAECASAVVEFSNGDLRQR